MAELKLTWAEFRDAALAHLSTKHPQIALNRDDNARLVRNLSYEGECEVAEVPHFVYVKLED